VLIGFIKNIQNACLFICYVKHWSLTFSDIITLLTRHTAVHFPHFSPEVVPSGEVNYLITFMKREPYKYIYICCALPISEGPWGYRVNNSETLQGLFLSFYYFRKHHEGQLEHIHFARTPFYLGEGGRGEGSSLKSQRRRFDSPALSLAVCVSKVSLSDTLKFTFMEASEYMPDGNKNTHQCVCDEKMGLMIDRELKQIGAPNPTGYEGTFSVVQVSFTTAQNNKKLITKFKKINE